MVAQVGPAPLAVYRTQRQHGPPLDLARFEALDQLPVALDPQGAEVVEQHSDLDAALRGLFQCGEQVIGDVVRAHDVELGVDEVLRPPHGRGHGFDRVGVTGQ
ncbi:hypothetical protein D9M72_476230 [compost metagenome]